MDEEVMQQLEYEADQRLNWYSIPELMDDLAARSLPLLLEAGTHFAKIAADCTYIWLNPDTKALHFLGAPPESLPTFCKRSSAGGLPATFGQEPWMLVKLAEGAFRPVFSALQMVPNRFNEMIGGPTPMAATLAGGLMGAGLGYGGGWVAEHLLPEDKVKRGRLRKLTAALGGVAGALPGAYLGVTDMRQNAAEGQNPWKAWLEPNRLFGTERPGSKVIESSARDLATDLDTILPNAQISEHFAKNADDAGGLFMPEIPVDSFNRVIWQDPNTPMPIRAAVTGLTEAASQSRGGANFVSPFDIGRIAVGMGSGLTSGFLVGKALGALAGLTPSAQKDLQRAGMWSGALINIIPRMF